MGKCEDGAMGAPQTTPCPPLPSSSNNTNLPASCKPEFRISVFERGRSCTIAERSSSASSSASRAALERSPAHVQNGGGGGVKGWGRTKQPHTLKLNNNSTTNARHQSRRKGRGGQRGWAQAALTTHTAPWPGPPLVLPALTEPTGGLRLDCFQKHRLEVLKVVQQDAGVVHDPAHLPPQGQITR